MDYVSINGLDFVAKKNTNLVCHKGNYEIVLLYTPAKKSSPLVGWAYEVHSTIIEQVIATSNRGWGLWPTAHEACTAAMEVIQRELDDPRYKAAWNSLKPVIS